MPLVHFKEAVAGIKVAQTPSTVVAGVTEVPLVHYGGAFAVPVLINDFMVLHFTVDSGAADVSIPADVVMTMERSGTLSERDFLGERQYVLADGSIVTSRTFRIRSLKVGDRVIENVLGSEAHVSGSLLLGQSFLKNFTSWSIDNNQQVLILLISLESIPFSSFLSCMRIHFDTLFDSLNHSLFHKPVIHKFTVKLGILSASFFYFE